MKLKKFALRGMIILAAVIALCVLFSGTFRSLTTPKVKLVPPKTGKLETITKLTGMVTFPEEEEMNMKIPDGLSLTVTRVYVVPGQEVSKGDRLMNAVVTNADKDLADLQTKYDTARNTLDNWNRKNGDLRLTRNEEAWMNAYYATRDAEDQELEIRHSLMANLDLNDSEELTDNNVKAALKKMNKKMGQPILEEYNSWVKAKDAVTEARKTLKSLDRYAVAEDVWNTLKQKSDAEDELKEVEEQMRRIRLLQKQGAEIVAPHNGYVIEIKAQKDAQLNGEAELLKITPEGKGPVLRAMLGENKKSVQKGAVVSIPISDWSRVETKITATGVTKTGLPYADAPIPEELTWNKSISTMVKEETAIEMKLITRAKQATTLLPPAAVHSDGDKHFVYVGRQNQSTFGDTSYEVSKRDVTVLGETDKWVSVEEDLSWETVLYLEDRELKEGSTVIEYEE